MTLPDENGYTPKYKANWTRVTPGLIVFLIDQSASMSQFGAGEEPIAERVAKLVNSAILELCKISSIGEELEVINTMHIICIGYGNDNYGSPYLIGSHYLSDYDKWLYETNGCIIKPCAEGVPNMTDAFAMTAEIIQVWEQREKNNGYNFHDPVPMIFHLTKGANIGDDEKLIENAHLIKNIEMRDGHPLLFNLLFPTHDFFDTIDFPTEEQLNAIGLNEEYMRIVKTASVLPKAMIEEYLNSGYDNIKEDSLCLLVNPTRIPIEHIRNNVFL